MDRLDNNTLVKIVSSYKNKERELFNSLMESIPSGAPFYIGGPRFRLAEPSEDEMMIWKLSTLGKSEYGSVRTFAKNIIVRVAKDRIGDLEPIKTFVEEYKTMPTFFSNAHWNPKRDPIPSRNDLRFFKLLKNINPEINCRVITKFNSKIRSVEYLGD